MSDIPARAAEHEVEKGNWGEIFRDGLGLYSALVIGGIAMHATQMLSIATIIPTSAADIGGAAERELAEVECPQRSVPGIAFSPGDHQRRRLCGRAVNKFDSCEVGASLQG